MITLLSIGCAHVGYVGHSLGPTAEVDLYCSKEDIEKEYTVMGHAIGTGTSNNDATSLDERRPKKGSRCNPDNKYRLSKIDTGLG